MDMYFPSHMMILKPTERIFFSMKEGAKPFRQKIEAYQSNYSTKDAGRTNKV